MVRPDPTDRTTAFACPNPCRLKLLPFDGFTTWRKGGKSFICLPSTHERKGARKSRMVFDLTQGNIATTPRTDMYAVRDYGMANLKGRSVPECARLLIELAHPDFREDLERKACEYGLIPRALSVTASKA